MGRGFLFLCALQFSFLNAQLNLVQNGSFEQLDTCPQYPNLVKLAVPWDTLRAGGGGGPDLFNACANPGANLGMPVNVFGLNYQWARTGNGYVEFVLYTPPSLPRFEYIQNELAQTLVAGHSYCITFYCNVSNRSQYAVDEFGAYLDDGSVASSGWFQPAVLTPSVKSPPGVFISDTLQWMKVQGIYTANGSEKYISLGNFRTSAGTNYVQFNPSAQGQVAEYYVDDVSVIDISEPAFAGNDTTIISGDSVFIGRPNETGLDDDCMWYILGNANAFDTAAGLWVSPLGNTTYVLEQNICDVVTYDTVNVYVSGVGLEELRQDDSFELWPNPASGFLELKLKRNWGGKLSVHIINCLGQVVLAEEQGGNIQSLKINTQLLSEGIYFICLSGNNESSAHVRKFVVRH
jgi:hypothetical protein